MGDKKRKSLDSAQEVPKKKSKKSEPSPTPLSVVENAAVLSKKTRKRAADFMEEEGAEDKSAVATETAAAPKPSKKSKNRKEDTKAETLTADGVNGVVEHAEKEDVETATKAPSKTSSMQQEAQNTVDKEIAEEFASFSEDDEKAAANEASDEEDEDAGAALLTGFDSDSADEAQDEGDLSKTPSLPQFKKTQKKLRQAKEKGGQDEPGTVYVGRIPHGFYEKEMRAFFTQFGDITRLRLSRNKQTGASKHFAFIEFASTEVAKIVAEAMDNYLMFGHILKCKYAPAETLHPDTFKGANKKYRKIPHAKLEAAKLTEPKSVEQWQKKNQKEKKKRNQKAKKLKQIMGYEAPNITLADPAAVSKQKQLESPKAANSLDAAADRQLRVENGDTPAVKKATTADKVTEEVAASPAPLSKKAKANVVNEEVTPETVPAAGEKKAKKEKYVPPTHKKQAEKAKFAKEHPEEVKQVKKEKEIERLQKRVEKKAKKNKTAA